MTGKQHGFVLFTAIIMLVAITLISIALVKAVNTNNDVASNIGFLQSASVSADQGIEAGIQWLQNNRNSLNNDNRAAGYYASDNELVSTTKLIDYTGQATPGNLNDDVNWSGASAAPNQAVQAPNATSGDQIAYIIHRLCVGNVGGQNNGNYTTAAGLDPNNATCAKMSLSAANSGSKSGVAYGSYNISSKSQVYYRITARALGPRNTASYTQAIVVMEY